MNSDLDAMRERQFGLVICRIFDDLSGCELKAAPGGKVGHGLERARLGDAEEMQQTLSAHIGGRSIFSPWIVAALQWAIPIVEPGARSSRSGGR